MNNKIHVVIMMIAAIALIGGINIYNAQKTVGMSDIALANVEALADNESGPGKTYCCGNSGTCALIVGGGEIVGIPFVTPCPQ